MPSHTPDPVTLAPEKTQIVHDINQKHGDQAQVTTSGDKSIHVGEVEVEDAFQPLLDVEPYDGRQILTVRAVLTGVFLGSIISCANLYLGKAMIDSMSAGAVFSECTLTVLQVSRQDSAPMRLYFLPSLATAS